MHRHQHILTRHISNTKILFIWSFFRNFYFSGVIWNLFYLSRGFDLKDLAIFGLTYNLAQLIFELPSGLMADKWGRKKTLIISRLVLFPMIFLIIFSNNYLLILLAWCFDGISSALASDTDTSLIYDELDQKGQLKKYGKILASYNILLTV